MTQGSPARLGYPPKSVSLRPIPGSVDSALSIMRVTLLTSTFALVGIFAAPPATGIANGDESMDGGAFLTSFASGDGVDDILVSILEEVRPVNSPEPLWCETASDPRCNPDPASQPPSFRWPAPGGTSHALAQPRLSLVGPIKRDLDFAPIGSSHFERIERPPRG